jgi:hypothetical protein
VIVVVTADAKVNSFAQIEIENYDVEFTKGQHYIVTVSKDVRNNFNENIKTAIFTNDMSQQLSKYEKITGNNINQSLF